MKVTASIIFIFFVLLVVSTVYILHARRLRRKNRALSRQLMTIKRLQALDQAIMTQIQPQTQPESVDNDAATGGSAGNKGANSIAGNAGTDEDATSIDIRNAIQNEHGGKNENIVWLACRKMCDEKVFCDPTLNRKQLADLLGTNENYLASAIREVNEGQTVNDFINKYRLDYACSLITGCPQMKLETIARESGFMTRTTLFRLFHKKFGMSPGQYREEYLKEMKDNLNPENFQVPVNRL